jgi:hypothetical protein
VDTKRVEALRKKIRTKLAEKRRARVKLVEPVPPPRYDNIYFEGVAWLDSLAGSCPRNTNELP